MLKSLDHETGEILEGVAVWISPKVRGPYGRKWFMQSQDAVLLLAQDKELAGQPTRVLLYLLARLDFENFIYVKQTDIAEALEITAPRVSTAIAILTSKGILLRGPKVGHSFAWRLNPNFGWKGKVTNLKVVNRARSTALPA